MLKLYFEDYLLNNNNQLSFLNPILGIPQKHVWGESKEQISSWYDYGKNLIEKATNIQESDYLVFPVYFNLGLYDELKKLSDKAKKFNKKVLVFYCSDIEDYININDNIIWFKRSVNNLGPKNEISLPAFPNDLTSELSEKNIDKTIYNTVTIGYTGYSNYYNINTFVFYYCLQMSRLFFRLGFVKKIILKTKNEEKYHLLTTLGIGKYVRGKIIGKLKKLNNIKFNYIERKTGLYIDAKEKFRQDYIENIQKSLFSLVIRGN